MPIISKKCLNKDRKFCKLSKCFDSDTILRRRVAREEFLFILSLLKSLMSLYLESIDTGWSESLKGVSMELNSVKKFRIWSGKMLVSLEKRKLLNPGYIRKILEFDCSENEEVFDWQHKHTCRNCYFFYFTILFIVKISTNLMDHCLARYSRNLVLFCFYFSIAEIIKDFCGSQCNFQVTYGLYLYIKLWSWFEIHKTIKTKDYTLNWLTFLKIPVKAKSIILLG